MIVYFYDSCTLWEMLTARLRKVSTLCTLVRSRCRHRSSIEFWKPSTGCPCRPVSLALHTGQYLYGSCEVVFASIPR